MMKLPLTMLLLAIAPALFSQSVDSQIIQWTVSGMMDVNTNALTELNDAFVSVGTARIEWKDSRERIKRTFVIREVNGVWNDVSVPGSLLFEIDAEGRAGTLRFSRKAGKVLIELLLLRDGDNPEMYEFYVTEIATL